MRWRILEFQDIDIAKMHAAEEFLYKNIADDNIMLFSTVKPGISIAMDQNYYLDVNEKACKYDHVPIARRETGGRSMYLDHNYLILSLISRDAKIDPRLHYNNALSLVITALEQVTQKKYSIAHQNDIMVEGRKVGGAAQRQSRGTNIVHCYLRKGEDLHKMLRYVKIDGHELSEFLEELRPYLASLSEFTQAESFHDNFKQTLIAPLDYYESHLTSTELEQIERIAIKYTGDDHIKGKETYPSKGNCDIIEGSKENARLKISSLEGVVKFS